jgi:hypothetical protein
VSLTAVIPAAMPMEWMHQIHRWLGLGSMPEGAIVDYLARSTSGAYAVFGVFLILFSLDVQRYRTPIFLAAMTMLAAGVGLGLFHLSSGMPLYWRIGEPVACLAIGAIVLSLNLRFSPQASEWRPRP